MEGLDLTPALLDRLRELAKAGRWQEVKLRLTAVREELSADPWALLLLAEAHCRLNDPAEALAATMEALALFRDSGDDAGVLKACNEAGIALFELGDLDTAERRFAEALALAETTGAEGMRAKVANNLGAICTLRGRREQALQYQRLALACFQRLGEVRGQAETYHNLGITYRDLGLPAESDAFFAQAAGRAREAGDDALFGFALAARAELALQQQNLAVAEGASRQAMMRFDTSATPYGQAEALKLSGMIAARRGDLPTARLRLEQALDLSDVHGAPLLDAEIRLEHGLVLFGLGQIADGEAELERAALAFDRLGADELAERARSLLRTPDAPASL